MRSPEYIAGSPDLSDPLADIVRLLRPDMSFSKLIEAAGAWRVERTETGGPFYGAVLAGTPILQVGDGAPVALARGDFILIPSAYDFSVWSSAPSGERLRPSLPAEQGRNHFRLGDPGGPADVRMLVGYSHFASGDAGLLVSLLPRLVHVQGDERLTLLVRLLDDEARGARPARDVILARLVEVLMIEALRSAGERGPAGLVRGLGDARIAAAIRRVHERPTEDWSVVSLAREAGLSRSAFFARFRRTVGVPPMEYLLHWRMVMAKDLLSRETSVAEVAERVGYSSASTFSVAFARHVGVPPSVYARQDRAA